MSCTLKQQSVCLDKELNGVTETVHSTNPEKHPKSKYLNTWTDNDFFEFQYQNYQAC